MSFFSVKIISGHVQVFDCGLVLAFHIHNMVEKRAIRQLLISLGLLSRVISTAELGLNDVELESCEAAGDAEAGVRVSRFRHSIALTAEALLAQITVAKYTQWRAALPPEVGEPHSRCTSYRSEFTSVPAQCAEPHQVADQLL
ncbi:MULTISPECIES: hypothetical protein [unclassified Bradyrhizobium]|uniref:hypothetical protein n=1 Tax=Bradyrhizobium sp. USDA 4541 TaxID=2817704 RepID=UPI0020A3C938|nr:hypothetical protein [Bradyrhizobium sp. USDA 4541]MCP1850122.1 hypothetical protein [Bradyrhizobium sp. USDA 4541]